jgi:hypothetical protein
MIQSVIGPLRGIYVAMFACPVGELGDRFVGCYRLYGERPGCFCAPGHFGDGETASDHASADSALHGAALAARRAIRRWSGGAYPPAHQLDVLAQGIQLVGVRQRNVDAPDTCVQVVQLLRE